MKVLKRYRFHSEDDIIDIDVEVQNPTSKEVTLQLGLEWIGKIELAKLADEGNKDFGLKYAFLKNQKVEKKEFGGASSGGCVPSCGPQKKTIEPFEFSDKGEIKVVFLWWGILFCHVDTSSGREGPFPIR